MLNTLDVILRFESVSGSCWFCINVTGFHEDSSSIQIRCAHKDLLVSVMFSFVDFFQLGLLLESYIGLAEVAK